MLKLINILHILIFKINILILKHSVTVFLKEMKFIIKDYHTKHMKTLEDTGQRDPPSILLPYTTHLCLLPPSSPQEATEALYIPDKTFSAGQRRRWWRVGGAVG